MKSVHLGIDDTDSTQRGCTTYIAALLVEKLWSKGAQFLDYPNLIRLNPNIPWKTRGNAALCLRFTIPSTEVEHLVEDVVDIVELESDLNSSNTDPGIVFYWGKEIPPAITAFTTKAVHRLVTKRAALRLIKQFQCQAIGFKKGRGLIGALAAIGDSLSGDYTYEIIAYRFQSNRGAPRKVDDRTVFEMDKQTKGLTFNNVDYKKHRVLITPRGPDPVLLGIRGENPSVLQKAFKMLKIRERVERWVIFRTNQGTDAHLHKIEKIQKLQPYNAVIVTGNVIQIPRLIPGKHVIFTLGDQSATIDCAAYEPTGEFKSIVKKLLKGDRIEVYGGVRPPSLNIPMTINLEKIKIIELVPQRTVRNPRCPVCQKRMASMGVEKGFRCKKCGRRDRKAKKNLVPVERMISTKLYITPPRVHRHLTKPWSRYGMEKSRKDFILLKTFWGTEVISYL